MNKIFHIIIVSISIASSQKGDAMLSKKAKDGSQEWSVNSKEGKMIIFDSKIEHSVPINKSNKNRISLAFNLYSLPLDTNMVTDNYSSNKFYS